MHLVRGWRVVNLRRTYFQACVRTSWILREQNQSCSYVIENSTNSLII